jgi:diguanylate cyclase (GGDEF)-like protein/putative nucleotidyltransferase with HDIG domain
MLASPSTDEPSISGLNASSDAAVGKRSHQGSRDVRATGSAGQRRIRSNLLLNIPIGRRLALGFLIPALIAALTLSSVGVQSQQRLLQESTYYQHLFDAYTSLSAGRNLLEQLHTDVQQTVTYAAQPHPLPAILTEDETVVQGLAAHFNTVLVTYLQQDLLIRSSDLVALFTEAGHAAQIEEQRTYSEETQAGWQAYHTIQEQVLGLISAGSPARAQVLLVTQEQAAFSDAGRDLQTLIAFNATLLPSLHDAATVQVQKLLISTLLAVLGVLLGIGLVGWLISSTLVRRLYRLRSAAQAIASGQVDTRLDAGGRDEIAEVSQATNIMVDTLVGLLQETKQQRDELAKGEELKRLHEALQREQTALKEANSRLEALATTDMLTGLPNHRALQSLLEKECERARRYGHPLSLLFFDGDRFKQVNDTYGHAAGDVVLRELGERARNVLRAGDTVGRFGGEEFLVLLPETGEQEAKVVAERLRSAVAACPLATHEVEGGIALTVSIGMASFPSDGASGSSVREQADQAMYWAKRLGRNQVRTAAEAARANQNAALKAATAHALERQELTALDGRGHESQVRAEQLGLIYSLMGALDLREPGVSEHAHEVSDLVCGMARLLQFDEERTLRATTAAFLHDIGKIALPDRLLHQPRQHFSTQEWRLLHQHAELGADIVEASPWLADMAPAIRHHHERWDGTGDPDGLKGETIPLESRLIAIAEAYHAMISEQPYQAARSVTDALDELERRLGTQFDPAVLPLLRAVLESRQEGGASSWEHASPNLLSQV